MIVYFLLMPLTAINGVAMGLFSIKSGINKDWITFGTLIIINIVPLWAFITKYSKNIIFDELLFNVCLMGSYLITIVIFDNNTFSNLNWLGLAIAFLGFILLKIKSTKKEDTSHEL